MADLGISGKRIRKKPKYLRDDDEDDEESQSKPVKAPKTKKQKKDKDKSSKKSSSKSSKSGKHGKQAITLKIKLGGKKVTTVRKPAKVEEEIEEQSESEESDQIDIEGETVDSQSLDEEFDSVVDDVEESYISDDTQSSQAVTPTSSRKPVSKGKAAAAAAATADDDTSDEEREWLEAIESGDIDDYEKKKAEKNPALLTARQRKLLHGEEEEQLMELPTGYKNKTLTEEQLNVRKQRAIKRRQQALEKSEKAKKQTVDRLLKKSESAATKAKSRAAKPTHPHMRYSKAQEQITLSIPESMSFPLQAQKASSAPSPVVCGVTGCKNIKKYSCSKTNIPLCSLQCYKANLSKHPGQTTPKLAVT